MSAESPDPRARRRARAAQVARPACRRGRERAVEPTPELDRRGPARLPDPTGHERSRARAVRLRSASGAARNVGAHGYGPPSSHQHRPSAAASDRRASRPLTGLFAGRGRLAASRNCCAALALPRAGRAARRAQRQRAGSRHSPRLLRRAGSGPSTSPVQLAQLSPGRAERRPARGC